MGSWDREHFKNVHISACSSNTALALAWDGTCNRFSIRSFLNSPSNTVPDWDKLGQDRNKWSLQCNPGSSFIMEQPATFAWRNEKKIQSYRYIIYYIALWVATSYIITYLKVRTSIRSLSIYIFIPCWRWCSCINGIKISSSVVLQWSCLFSLLFASRWEWRWGLATRKWGFQPLTWHSVGVASLSPTIHDPHHIASLTLLRCLLPYCSH